MDQVLTPFAHLFTKAGVIREVNRAGADVIEIGCALRSLMIVALLRVRPI